MPALSDGFGARPRDAGRGGRQRTRFVVPARNYTAAGMLLQARGAAAAPAVGLVLPSTPPFQSSDLVCGAWGLAAAPRGRLRALLRLRGWAEDPRPPG